MNTEIIFSIFNTSVLPVWVLMLFAPKWKVTNWFINTQIVPTIIALAYAIIIFSMIDTMQGADFSSLAGIKKLFSSSNDFQISAAWFHYLAFDLIVGTIILKESQILQINHLFVVPCLIFTFLLGPVGFFMFQIIKTTVSIKGK
jgi:Domain of unknown function (DUF4281)